MVKNSSRFRDYCLSGICLAVFHLIGLAVVVAVVVTSYSQKRVLTKT